MLIFFHVLSSGRKKNETQKKKENVSFIFVNINLYILLINSKDSSRLPRVNCDSRFRAITHTARKHCNSTYSNCGIKLTNPNVNLARSTLTRFLCVIIAQSHIVPASTTNPLHSPRLRKPNVLRSKCSCVSSNERYKQRERDYGIMDVIEDEFFAAAKLQ